MKTNKGFTLIELLVVIAIIGILSSVVLASLNTARSKGSDAAIKSQLNSIKAEAALYYDNQASPSYVGLFGSGTQATKLYRAAVAQQGTCTAVSTSSATVWAAAVPLKSTTGYFCVDSTGNSTTTAAATVSASDADCN